VIVSDCSHEQYVAEFGVSHSMLEIIAGNSEMHLKAYLEPPEVKPPEAQKIGMLTLGSPAACNLGGRLMSFAVQRRFILISLFLSRSFSYARPRCINSPPRARSRLLASRRGSCCFFSGSAGRSSGGFS
jgi:hypothetical protein